MKSKFLFSTLIMAAAFSACTQEDIAVNDEMASMEIAGAKLLATGISINSGETVSSRVKVENGKASFTEGDKAAVAWALSAEVAKEQDSTKMPIYNTLYANHMLVHDGAKFQSRGNIYEGWHFSYRPFQYMPKPAQLEVVVNDSTVLVEKDLEKDWYLNGPMFSNALFLSDKNVDVEEGVVEANMPLFFVHNSIRPELNVTEDFTEDPNGLLQTIAITGITLNAGKGHDLFTEKFAVAPKGFKKIADNDTIDETYFGANKAFVPTLDSMVVTSIKNPEVYNLGGKSTARMFLAPTQDASNIELKDLSFRIDVAGGHFDVAYTDKEELTSVEEMNNKAIKKLLLLLKGEQDSELNKKARDLKELWITKDDGTRGQTPAQTIPMMLGLENFTADFLIADSTDWNGCVALANALKEETPIFTLKENAEVIFEKAIAVPDNGVTVKGVNANKPGKLIINDNLTWDNDVVVNREEKAVVVVVNENKQLDVVEGKLQPYRLYNYGIIKADGLSTIGTKDYNNLYYNNRIEIEYGAYVYPAARGVEGPNVIAYVATKKDETNPTRIAELVATTGNAHGHANVNTIIVNDTISIDFTKTIPGTEGTQGEEGRYNDTAGSQGQAPGQYYYGDLQDVSFEINGGEISSSNGAITVKAITMKGGDVTNVDVAGALTLVEGTNNIENSSIAGNVAITDGTNTIVTEAIAGNVAITDGTNSIEGATINGNVTVDNGTTTLTDVTIVGDLTNEGTVTIEGEDTEIANIVNNGTLNAKTNVVVETIAVNSGASANVDDNMTIWYTTPLSEGGYVQKGTTKGSILYYGAAQLKAAIEAAEDGETVTLYNDVELTEPLSTDKDITINLNGKTISNTVDFYNESEGKWSLISVNGSEVTIKGNGVVKSKENDCFAVDVKGGGKVVIEDGEFVGNIHAVYVFLGTAEIKGGKFSIQQLGANGYSLTLNCYDDNFKADPKTANIIVTGGSFYKFDPNSNASEGPNTDLVPDGYTSTADNDWYTVQK